MIFKHANLSRRGWLLAAARYATLGGISLLAWKLVSRSAGRCLLPTQPCQACQLLAHCGLPAARKAKQDEHAKETT